MTRTRTWSSHVYLSSSVNCSFHFYAAGPITSSLSFSSLSKSRLHIFLAYISTRESLHKLCDAWKTYCFCQTLNQETWHSHTGHEALKVSCSMTDWVHHNSLQIFQIISTSFYCAEFTCQTRISLWKALLFASSLLLIQSHHNMPLRTSQFKLLPVQFHLRA